MKLVMDAWCALWFWPLDRVNELPKRESFLKAVGLLLGDSAPDKSAWAMFEARGIPVNVLLASTNAGIPDTQAIADAVPWFGVARELAVEQNFHHWELIFTEVLGPAAERGGFDLILGNPPWIKAGWADAAVLGEIEPLLGVREARSADYNARRAELISPHETRRFYAEQFRRIEGSAVFLNSRRLYPELVGIQTNLYKNFIVRSWGIRADNGIVGLLHPEGPYDDPKGGNLRVELFPRLRAYYHFVNELQLFSDVGHQATFAINIYGHLADAISFKHISNLYSPETISACLIHNKPHEPVPGIKTDDDRWNTRPHHHRVVTIREAELKIFVQLLEEAEMRPTETRLPKIHTQEIIGVIRKMTTAPRRLMDVEGEYFSSVMFDETYAQRDGIITRQDSPSYQPESSADWVLSGPHIFVATPFAKSPSTKCLTKGSYDDIDLTGIDIEYLPRAVYRPGNIRNNRKAYNDRVPRWPDVQTRIDETFRYINRRRVNLGTERSLISAIVPPGANHMGAALLERWPSAIKTAT